jgi:predicted nucleic acid-binding protein
MCLIVDANAAGTFLAQKSAVIDWLLGTKGSPRLCAGGKLTRELEIVGNVRVLLRQLSEAGRLRRIPDADIEAQVRQLKSKKLHRSNDAHVLALAIASGARTLATADASLIADFKNPRIIHDPRGRVYRDPDKHGRLLCHTPQSCRVRAF